MEQWITVPLIKDDLREGTETFRIRLSDAVGAAPIVDTNLTVRILDDDPGFAFQYTPSNIGEQFPEAVLVVPRGSDQLDPASVRFQTEDGTAKAGLDYVATQGVLEFAAGETFKEIRIPILNDTLRESEESIRVRLLEPSAGTSLGSPALATVNIQDNELGYQPWVVNSPAEGIRPRPPRWSNWSCSTAGGSAGVGAAAEVWLRLRSQSPRRDAGGLRSGP